MEQKIPLLVVVGPTASGKTALAVALAKEFDGEVISADSMQIYKEMQIATAKPDVQEMDGVPHHLIDFVEPTCPSFSVAQYAKLAREAIQEVYQRKKLPILAGGTGLYINAVVNHLDYANIESDGEVRQMLEQQAKTLGNEKMLERLQTIDPELAKTLHPNNLGRILRALEVWELTGIPMSEHQRRSRLQPSPYALCMLGLDFADREALYTRINLRVDRMMEAGLVEEAQRVSQIYGGTARQAIGYKELQPWLDGNSELSPCVDRLKQMTRHYAKRQLTWFRRDERITWIFVDRCKDMHTVFTQAKNTVHRSDILCYTKNDTMICGKEV